MQTSVDVSVWNTQWLLATLAGVNHCRSGGEGLPSIEEVENEGEEVEVSSNYSICVCVSIAMVWILNTIGSTFTWNTEPQGRTSQ